MFDREKVGWDSYLQKVKNHAHNSEKTQNVASECEKSGKDNNHLTGLLEKSSITRLSLELLSKYLISSYYKGHSPLFL